MSQLPWPAWVTLAVVAGMFTALVLGTLATEAVLLAALAVLVLTGVVDADTALGGFANGGLATVAVLYVVVAGLRDTGALGRLARAWLRRPSTVARARWRVMLPVAAASAVMNNTPLVAAALPVVIGWARRWRLPVSALLLPLSYAAILGGVCTLIGTSTNIIVAGLLEAQARAGAAVPTLGFFTLTPVGLAVAACGLTWIALAARRWLGDRDVSLPDGADARTYFVELVVAPGGAIDGLSIEDAGLRHLPGGYLADVERGDELLAAVAPELRLRGGDRLAFVGDLDAILDLRRSAGLTQGEAAPARTPRARTLVEAVVSDHSPLLGRSIRDAQFRTRYNAAAVLMLPIALSIAGALHVSPLPFVIALTVAASCGFATPLGYQTHLMVFGPGGYRTRDFLRLGLPLDVIAGVVTVLVTPWVAPFRP